MIGLAVINIAKRLKRVTRFVGKNKNSFLIDVALGFAVVAT